MISNGLYWQDQDGNKWGKDQYTLEEATAAADTLEGCKSCLNCHNCLFCSNCEYCMDCTAGKSLSMCDGCDACTACIGCVDCFDCFNCADVSGVVGISSVQGDPTEYGYSDYDYSSGINYSEPTQLELFGSED